MEINFAIAESVSMGEIQFFAGNFPVENGLKPVNVIATPSALKGGVP